MSTRSMTLVQQLYSGVDDFIPLYRHCDGYPAEAGAALLEALKDNPKTCEAVVKRLLVGDIGEYRLATWMPDKQGDLEHVYVVASKDGAWTIRHYSRRRGWEEGTEDYRGKGWDSALYSLEDFRMLVNRDRQEMNSTMRARRMECEPYPML
jgi:hypothetical protein